jgi:hypothetical protein
MNESFWHCPVESIERTRIERRRIVNITAVSATKRSEQSDDAYSPLLVVFMQAIFFRGAPPSSNARKASGLTQGFWPYVPQVRTPARRQK